MSNKRAVIIGAGPAGLTAAYEFLERGGVQPVVLEASQYMGGISRTVNHKGNRIDIGGHRFFSKSDRVMQWWLKMMPLAADTADPATIQYHGMTASVAPTGDAGADPECVMLLRPRKSRIYYLRRFFDYPITLSRRTLGNLGLWRTVKIGVSYLRSALLPQPKATTLEQFFINRFGRELYMTFFKSYTEKVWGVPCDHISAEWGAQRIKGLSIWTTLLHAAKKLFNAKSSTADISQKGTQTSLIEQFLYPRLGPGQMWEEVARRVRVRGGEIHTQCRVDRIISSGDRVIAVEAVMGDGRRERFEGDFFLSTAPIQELMRSFRPAPPEELLAISDGLVYRDFITVGLLVRGLKIHDQTAQGRQAVTDNWIYIQEPDVRLGRLQIFNNWSPYLVKDPALVWLGLEYFCNESDALWQRPDEEMIDLAKSELAKIDIIDSEAVVDATVLRMPKTYPAYFGTYDRFPELRTYLDHFKNLFLVGRNGMHRYNNQDHSMLTAMLAVENILAGRIDKSNIWEVNTEEGYHEEKNASS